MEIDSEQPQIRYCVWELTLACDLGCRHCGSRAGKARPDELSTEECLDVVEQLAEIGTAEVTLIGGEAYLREDWDIIAAAVVARGMRCGMTTGARGLTDARLERAARAGIQQIGVSIDGLEQTHDALRGAKGSWAAATGVLRRIRAHGMDATVNSQINRLSMPELPALANLLVDEGVLGWQVQLTVPMGRAADRPEMLLQPVDLLELFPLLVWIKETRLDPAGILLGAGNNVGYFGGFERLLRPQGARGQQWNGCTAGAHVLGLEADGKIKGCPSLPSEHYTGGNIRDARLAEVIQTTPELRSLRERTVEDLWGFCRSCEYAEQCMAGCSWTSHVFFGRTGNNPYCIHRALELESRGQQERLIRSAPPAGRPFDHGLFEISVEALPEPTTPIAVLGVPLDQVMEAQSGDASLLSLDTLMSRIKPTGA